MCIRDRPVARAAVEAGANWLAVALVEEGKELREAGIEIPLEVDRDGEILDISISSVARSDMLKQPRLH